MGHGETNGGEKPHPSAEGQEGRCNPNHVCTRKGAGTTRPGRHGLTGQEVARAPVNMPPFADAFKVLRRRLCGFPDACVTREPQRKLA